MSVELDLQKEIRESCLRYLIRREHSQKELLQKLLSKGFEANDVQGIIDELNEQGWQSNDRFAESYARHKIKKGFGPVKISYELAQRGIDEADLDAIVLDISGSWGDILEQVYAKKYSSEKQVGNKEWQKRYRFLLQRGFSSDMINSFYKSSNIKIIYS